MVVVYYQGADWVEKDGRWLLHSSRTLRGTVAGNPADYAIRLDSLPQLPGMPVAVVNVVGAVGPDNKFVVDLPFLRYGWADADTAEALVSRFAYAFVQPPGSAYPPILDLRPLDGPFAIDGPGGEIAFEPFRVQHGRIEALGFRIAGLVYLPDVSAIPDAAWPALTGLDILVIDALRYRPHPTHTHVEQTLAWIAKAAPRRAILTNMHNDLDHTRLDAETPGNVTPAHDGMVLDLDP